MVKTMPDWIITLLTLIIGSSGLIAALAAWRRDAKKAPIEAQTAQVADAIAVSHAAASLIEIQNAKFAGQDTKIDKLIAELDNLRNQLYAWQIWYNTDLVANWDIHRIKENPPAPPQKKAPNSL